MSGLSKVRCLALSGHRRPRRIAVLPVLARTGPAVIALGGGAVRASQRWTEP